MTLKEEKLSKVDDLLIKQGYSFELRLKIYFTALEDPEVFDLVEEWVEKIEAADLVMEKTRKALNKMEQR